MGDEYYEEEYEEAVQEGEEEVDWAQHVADKQDEITGMLNDSKVMDALRMSLAEAPVGVVEEEPRQVHVETVMTVLGAIKDTDIERFVKNLTEEEGDILMRYIYRGMETSDNYSSLLKWHGKVFDQVGVGSIVRALVARQQI